MHWLHIVYITALAMVVCGCNGTIGGFSSSGSPDAGSPADAPGVACPGGGEPIAWFSDVDGDLFGDPMVTIAQCDQPTGFVADDTDCDDRDSLINPDAREVCGDDVDNDCAGGDACLGNLRAHWAFNELDGAVTADASGRGHTGTLQNGPQFEPDQSLIHFDGTDDYIEVPHADDFLLDQGTVSIWFRLAQLDVAQGLWSKDSSGLDTGGHLSISVTAANAVRMRLQGDEVSTISISIDSVETVTTGVWYHVTATFGPAGMILYVDGVEAARDDYAGGTGTTSGDIGNLEPIVMGSLSTTSGNQVATPTSAPLLGDLADVRVYDRALEPGEIADLMDVTAP